MNTHIVSWESLHRQRDEKSRESSADMSLTSTANVYQVFIIYWLWYNIYNQRMKSKDIVSKHVLYDRTEADSLCLVRGDNEFSEKQCSDLPYFNLQPANQNSIADFKWPILYYISETESYQWLL